MAQRAAAGRPFRYCRDNDGACQRASRNVRMRHRNAPGLAGQVARTFEVVDRLDQMVESLTEALHPSAIVVMLRTSNDRLEPVAPAASGLPSLDAAPLDREASKRIGATLVKPGELPSSISPLAVIRPELVAPMQGLEQRVEGLLVLGPRLSEEPYAREDRDLISSVASQAGAALQNFRPDPPPGSVRATSSPGPMARSRRSPA